MHLLLPLTSVSPPGPESAVGAPHGFPSSSPSPALAGTSAFSILSSSPSIPPLPPFPWQPHPLLCRLVLRSHLLFPLSSLPSARGMVHLPLCPLLLVSHSLLLCFLSPSMFSYHLRAIFIYLLLKKKEKGGKEGKETPVSPARLLQNLETQMQSHPRRGPLPATLQAPHGPHP